MDLPILTFDFKADDFIEIQPDQAGIPEAGLIHRYQSLARAAVKAQKKSLRAFRKMKTEEEELRRRLETAEMRVEAFERSEFDGDECRERLGGVERNTLEPDTANPEQLRQEGHRLAETSSVGEDSGTKMQEVDVVKAAFLPHNAHGSTAFPANTDDTTPDKTLVLDLTKENEAHVLTIREQAAKIQEQAETILARDSTIHSISSTSKKLETDVEKWLNIYLARDEKYKQLQQTLDVVLDSRNKLIERLLDSNGGVCIYICPRDMAPEPSHHDFSNRHAVQLYDEHKEMKQTLSGLDHVFQPHETNAEKWEKTLPFAEAAFADNPGPQIILAYGSTGSGKTHLMSSQKDTSILPSLLRYLFDGKEARETGMIIEFQASAVHAYRGKMYDLQRDDGSEMVFRRATTGTKCMEPVTPAIRTAIPVPESGMGTFRRVTSRRDKLNSSNAVNSNSSRSHFIFTIHVRIARRDGPALPPREIYIIDLAGSEAPTGKPGSAIFEEGTSINASLGNFKALLTAVIAQNRALQHDPSAQKKDVEKTCMNLLNDKSNPLLLYMLKPLLDQRRRILFFACVYGSGRYVENARTMRQVGELVGKMPVKGKGGGDRKIMMG
ncbi:P-loop containing nucleoside triphosphate hydrolase protein [Dothidotthia symphoricarpi CBS 119687]|uniref:P-loop containing nucleoside triphosphate hydrolase protein n=1 Tax=Dothidotthia symphoricarpi CBS 119687 TaxID=1392245 RepID=A0A6A5ZYE1_9PLEO|nr:P-loop containing nucleoside triphosphate hydrolase protein [Dothidotthia symphoricarpi CBS 119687]KAF2123797.1 P-loop containing nucleoside triphosphate hydrolase protein [Dothidotthia symphoricarpi CBS 119687]